MIIKDVMEYIWSDVTADYNLKFDKYSSIDSYELYCEVLKDIPIMDKGINSPFFVENILPSCGCAHRHYGEKLAGCSMCDWESKNIKQCAKMAALRDKNKALYAEVIKKSIEFNRGPNIKPALIEELATHDLLDEKDIPNEVFDKIFITDKLFTTKPMVGLMAARPSSITKDKIQKWKSQYRKSIIVGMGIETSSEFLRNHWINKNTNNDTIIKALNILNEGGAKSSGDILLGLPGIPAGHAIQNFKETLAWLNGTNIDTILVSPLSRKDKTLQEFIYRKLFMKGKIKELYQGENYYTDIPSPFTILQALCEAVKEIPDIEIKLKISPQNTKNYLQQIRNELNSHDFLDLELEFLKLLEKMSNNNMSEVGIDIISLFNIYDRAQHNDKFITNKEKNLAEQGMNLNDVLIRLIEEIASEVWPNDAESKVSDFKMELVKSFF